MFTKRHFGNTSDQKEVFIFENENKNGMKISVLNFGGIITSLKVPNKNGEIYDIVLGYDDLESYEKQTTYFGAIVGRCCNRIDGSKFTIDKTEYLLNSNLFDALFPCAQDSKIDVVHPKPRFLPL